jgi:predicted transcriptional regulator
MPVIHHSLVQFRKDPLIMVAAHTIVMDAQHVSRTHGLHHLPVTNEGELVGVICTCDMLHEPPDALVSSFMHEPISLELNDSIDEALELMTQHTVGSVILLEDERPVGIVTRSDLGAPFSVTSHDPIPRCERCGIRAHLRRTDSGYIFCLECASDEGFLRPHVLLSV